nr:hypothetical protein GCM10020093_012130 [Planobispora longispora]
MPVSQSAVHVINHLDRDYLRQALEHDVRAGLTAMPKQLPPKWFYDATGSELFTQITRLPEYYPTRRELAILRERAADIAAACGADTLVELGSGTSEKTVLLLDALTEAGTLRAYTPVDVDALTLTEAARRITARSPGSPCGRSAPTSSTTWGCCRGRAGGWWPSSAAPSATSTRPRARSS